MATVVVYAGAILVTFLFVLMLAQPEGQALLRPRSSWEAAGLGRYRRRVMVGVLTIGRQPSVLRNADDAERHISHACGDQLASSDVLGRPSTWPHLGRQLVQPTSDRGRSGRHAAAGRAGGQRWRIVPTSIGQHQPIR